MSIVASTNQEAGLFTKCQSFLMENVMRNTDLGIFLVLVLLGIYIFKIVSKKSEPQIYPKKETSQSKIMKKYQKLMETKQAHKLEESYRDQLIRELQEESNKIKVQKREVVLHKEPTLTIAESFIRNRGMRLSKIQKMNNAMVEHQYQEKEKERKRKEAIEEEKKEKERKRKEAIEEEKKEKQRQKRKEEEEQKKRNLEKKKQEENVSLQTQKSKENKNNDVFGSKIPNPSLEESAELTPNTKQKPQNSLFGGQASSVFEGKTQEQEFLFTNKKIQNNQKSKTGSYNFGSLFNQQTQKNQTQVPSSIQTLIKPSQPKSIPSQATPSLKPSEPVAPLPSASAALEPSAPRQKLTPEAFLDTYVKFGEKPGEEVPIATKMEDLLGARSLPSQILTEAKGLINSIDKNDDKQLTSFANALFHSIVYQFINKSNIKSNLERIPPKSRTDQCEKNSINKYVLTVNIYRLMGQTKKVWVIVFGKLLKLLEFLYKRKKDLESYHQLELIQNGYIKKYKEIHSKYLCRIDFLIYMLLALTSFDPILIFRQVQEKQKGKENPREEIESWGNRWSYAEFWALCQVIFANKHQSYFKPVVYINMLYTLYPRIYQNKKNPSLFKAENQLFAVTLEKAKKYLERFKNISQVKMLKEEDDENSQMNYEFDGDDFIKSIKVLDNRIPEKGSEFRLNTKDFEARANVFYYFSKEK